MSSKQECLADKTTEQNVLYVRTQRELGEEARKLLLNNDMLLCSAPVFSENNSLFLPLVDGTSSLQAQAMLCSSPEPSGLFDVASLHFETRSVTLRIPRPTSYRQFLDVADDIHPFLPSSWDVVGNIIVVKLRSEAQAVKGKIGGALLDAHKNISSVYMAGKVSGSTRVRELEYLAGRRNTLTFAREYGVVFQVDIAEAYYSPRLATERWRVVSQVKSGENVLDMFAGVGPFSLLIARHTAANSVFSLDINPKAISLFQKNIETNDVGNVSCRVGDARELVDHLGAIKKFDRIIMNLPHSSWEYIDAALECSVPGTIIHLYLIGTIEEIDVAIAHCVALANKEGRTLVESKRTVTKTYSPHEINVCSDLLVG